MKKVKVLCCLILIACFVFVGGLVIAYRPNINLLSNLLNNSSAKDILNIESEPEKEDLTQISKSEQSYQDYEKIRQLDGYNSLSTDSQKKIYDMMEEAVYSISEEKDDSNGYYPIKKIVINDTGVSSKTLMKVFLAFRGDNPSVFWLASNFRYLVSDEKITFKLYSFLSPAVCEEYKSELEAKVREIIESVPLGLSEFERERYMHDWILNNCVYDEQNPEYGHMSHQSYAAIVLGHAVCEGYSKAMQLLLSQVGVRCRQISGFSKGESHMWNLVFVNQEWYHLDVTWDGGNFKNFNYFNVNDDIIKVDHDISPDFDTLDDAESSSCNLSIPECKSMDANYYTVEAIKVDSLGGELDNKITDGLYKKLSSGYSTVFLQVSDSLNYESAFSQIFTQPPYRFSSYVNSVNTMLDGKQINIDNIKYVKIEPRNVIMVMFEIV